jgi:hypothetical protein
VSVALVIQLAKHMRHIVICGLPPLYSIFPHYLTNDMIFGEKSYWTQNVLLLSLQTLAETFLIRRKVLE